MTWSLFSQDAYLYCIGKLRKFDRNFQNMSRVHFLNSENLFVFFSFEWYPYLCVIYCTCTEYSAYIVCFVSDRDSLFSLFIVFKCHLKKPSIHTVYLFDLQGLLWRQPSTRFPATMCVQLTELPPEILSKIFSFLTKDDLVQVAQVCKHLRRLCLEDPAWKPLKGSVANFRPDHFRNLKKKHNGYHNHVTNKNR